MIYLFQCINRQATTGNGPHKFYIEADSEQNARFQIHADYKPTPERAIGRFTTHPHLQSQAQGKGA